MIVIITDRPSSLWASFACGMLGLQSMTLGMKPIILLDKDNNWLLNPLYKKEQLKTRENLLHMANNDFYQSLLLQFQNFTKDFFMYSGKPLVFNNINNREEGVSLFFQEDQYFLNKGNCNNVKAESIAVRNIIISMEEDFPPILPWENKIFNIKPTTFFQEIQDIANIIGNIYNNTNSFHNVNLLPHSTTTAVQLLSYGKEV